MLRKFFMPGIAAGLVLFGAGCSDSSGPGGGTSTDVLTTAQAQQLGGDIVLDAAEMFEVPSYDPMTGIPMTPGPWAGPSRPPQSPCVTVSPLPPVNSDGDIVPDSLRFDFAGCVFTHHMGQVTDSLDGTIDIIDPLPLTTSHGVRHVYTQFTRARMNEAFPGRSFIAVHNGTREWGASPDTLGHMVTNFMSQWTHPSGFTSTHQKDWAGKFTALTPGTIQPGQPLPGGSWTLDGTSEWERGGTTWSVVIATIDPLVFDPTCDVPPMLTAGSLHLVVTRNDGVTNVDITFTACGQYTVTRTPVVTS
ncbi:MAG: hypothetical protein E4H38_00335 [Gemmatimonadales bacterium]|nr:MAG: hypothetical protein E4H38_00335 [Gemmatimonadales bacterium]